MCAAAIWLTFILLLPFTVSASGQTRWIHVETLQYDWNHDGKPCTFILDRPSNFAGGGDYTRLRVVAENGARLSFVDNDGLTDFADSVAPNWVTPHFTAIVKRNPVASRRLLFVPVDLKSSKPFLLCMFGWPYASSPGSIHIIASINGVPEQVLYRREFQIVDYRLNDNSPIQIVGEPCFSQQWGNGLLTYDPYWVFSVPSGGAGGATLSIPLSREYNLKHYYGWAGPNCSEKLAVVLHPPSGGKPVIMDAKKAEALTDKKGNQTAH
jgi:hypothetical protein